MSAPNKWAAWAICTAVEDPGNWSRRRPASQGDVLLSGIVAVSLDQVVNITATFTAIRPYSSMRAEIMILGSRD